MPAQTEQISGDDEAVRESVFARIVSEHARFLYRVAYSVLRHAQDSEDALQDALLKLYRSESWRTMQDERAFLARVVWRAALDRRARRTESPEYEDAALRIADERPGPEISAERADECVLLHELIDTLPEQLRQPLLLSAMEEMSSREIGEVMGLPEGTVRTRLMRARSELKAKFEARNAGRDSAQAVGAGERSRR
jgi:RNA polymerase sigma-70 factor, ECF subfamily